MTSVNEKVPNISQGRSSVSVAKRGLPFRYNLRAS